MTEASTEQTTNLETSASTPNSPVDTQNQTKTPKDRQCPFCEQPFTSSSLGRHLDLYIRSKNPKPPDGIHDVEEIRKLRGGITRRQPRTSNRASGSGGGGNSNTHSRQGSTGNAVNEVRTKSEAAAQEETPIHSPINAKDVHENRAFVNKANWQATGVINNLPPRAQSRNANDPPSASTGQAQRNHEMRRDDTGNRTHRSEYETESMWKLQDAAELGRAAEMALREVLGSLEAASKKVEPKLLFEDFDFYSLSFPALCLAILPAPSTLFSPIPFPSAESWTLAPPGLRQFEAMSRFINEKASYRRRTEHIPDSVLFRHHGHLSGAWEHWEAMTESERSSAWHLEILRSFARAQERISQLRSELEHSQQRNRHMEFEYDRLSRCQLPREYLMHPPNTLPVSDAVMKELKGNQTTTAAAWADYDADALLSKWRATIRATSRKPAPQMSSQSTSQQVYSDTYNKNQLRDDIVMNGAIINVGILPRHGFADPEPATNDHPSVLYETPPNPGAVVGADDDEHTTEANADGNYTMDDRTPRSRYDESASLVQRRRLHARSPRAAQGPGGGLNANGKRPLASNSTTGSRETRILKEHFIEPEGAPP